MLEEEKNIKEIEIVSLCPSVVQIKLMSPKLSCLRFPIGDLSTVGRNKILCANGIHVTDSSRVLK